MTLSKLCVSFLLAILMTSNALADDTCLDCNTTPNSAMLENTSSNATSSHKPDFEDTSNRYCVEFGQQSESTVNYYLKTELEKATYYSVEDYFQRAGCRIEGYGGDVKAPLLHMVVDYPSYRQNFAEKVFNYYHKRRKSHDLWLKAINAKNTKGQTLLDYLESQLQANAYRNEGTLNAAKSIGKYICENGGVYSKYADKKCP